MSSFDALWQERYGADAKAPSAPTAGALAALELMMAHRTVRAYLKDPLPAGTLDYLMAAAQSAATSSNLQTWSVIAVEDPERKARLAQHANAQAHIKEAPMLLIWLADLSRLDRTAQRVGSPSDANHYTEMFLVAAIDAALAAQNAVLAAESLGLGSCYIGAMRNLPAQVAAELKLPKRVFPVFGMTLGRPDPARPAGIKPRLQQDTILYRETYGVPLEQEVARIEAYDAVIQAFQTGQKMALTPWSTQSSQRVAGPGSLSGRDKLVAEIQALGFELK